MHFKRVMTLKKIMTLKNKTKPFQAFMGKIIQLGGQMNFFQKIDRDTISSKQLIFSNLLVNLFSAKISTLSVFIVDFKLVRLSKEEVDTLIKRITKLDEEYSEFILKKIGYLYDKERMMLSIIYAKGKFSILNIDQILSKHQDKKLNEILLKNCLIYEMINNNNKILTLKNNALIPNLFFYFDKQGISSLKYTQITKIKYHYSQRITLVFMTMINLTIKAEISSYVFLFIL